MSETEKIIEKRINDYITKYATKHNISFDEAKQHVIVKITERFLKGESI